jgi:tRNA(Ile)-lysidine synthase
MRLCLGYSGGLDSTVLLHLLARLRSDLDFVLTALHVHHGLSPHADAWAANCARVCQSLAVPLGVEHVTVTRAGKGMEAAARQVRYQAYAKQSADFVVLAHQLDDQIETFLMRLLRGSGLRGLQGMAPETRQHDIPVLRPLLAVPRAALERYAAAHGLGHVEDESNQDIDLTRNYLRAKLLPVLSAHFPAYRGVLTRTMSHIQEADALLDQLARDDVASMDDKIHPRVKDLLALGYARGKNLLRFWLADQLRLTPGSAPLYELWRQLESLRADAVLRWQVERVELRVFQGRLYAQPVLPADDVPDAMAWHGETSLAWGTVDRLIFRQSLGEGVALASIAGKPVVVRPWRAGGRLRPDCRRDAKALSKWFQAAEVPPWRRRSAAMLYIDGELAWVEGVGVDCRFQAHADEPGWVISRQPPL